MNLSLVSPFVYLASEKISAENLFEGFNVDLQSTVDLIKSLSSYNPTVWTYMSSITKSVMQPLGVAILSVVLILEFSKMAKKNSLPSLYLITYLKLSEPYVENQRER